MSAYSYCIAGASVGTESINMLNTTLTFCIVGLFAGWIWRLKRQLDKVSAVRDDPVDEGAPAARAPSRQSADAFEHHSKAPSRHGRVVETLQAPHTGIERNHDGVPVWSID